ncbi:MAG: hypothetical protein QM762_30430 [Chryseolinea sp.]
MSEAGIVDAVFSITVILYTIILKVRSLAAVLNKVTLSVATAYKEEETGALVSYLAPDLHYLEVME